MALSALSPPNPSSNILRSLAAVVRRSQSNFRFRFEWLRSSHSVARISIRGVTPSSSLSFLPFSLSRPLVHLSLYLLLPDLRRERGTNVGWLRCEAGFIR